MPGGSIAPYSGNAAFFNSIQPPPPSGGSSWWDTITGAISGGWNRLTNAATGGLGGVQTGVAGGQMRVQAQAAPIANAPKTFAELNYPNAVATAATTRGATTAVLFANPDVQNKSLSFLWNQAGQVSFGQAVQSTPAFTQFFGHGWRPWWMQTDAQASTAWAGSRGAVPVGPYGGLDPTNPDVRAKAFESGGVGEIASWGTDAVGNYFLDPTVIAGGAAKPLIALARGAAIGRGGAAALELGPELGGNLGKRAIPLVGPRQATVYQISQDIANQTGAVGQASRTLFDLRGNTALLANHALLARSADRFGLAGVLSSTQTYDEWATVLAAAHGDPTAQVALATTQQAMARALKTETTRYESMVSEQNLGQLDPVANPWRSTQSAIDVQRGIVDNLTARDAWLTRAVGSAEGDPGVFRSMSTQTFSPMQAVNAMRDARAAQRAQAYGERGQQSAGYFTTRRFTPVDGSTTVAVTNWFGTPVPAGHLAVAGPLKLASEGEMLAAGRAANMPLDELNAHVRAFALAATETDAMTALANFEQAGVRSTFLRHFPDVTPGSKEYDDIMKAADSYLTQHGLARSGALAQMEASGGFIHDEANDEMIKFSHYDPNLIPMVDFRALDKALATKATEEGTQSLSDLVAPYGAVGGRIAGAFMSLWKPTVLLRVGAIPKNVGESWLASWMYTGRLPGDIIGGTRNYAANRWNRNVLNNPINPWRWRAQDRVKFQTGLINDAADQRKVAEQTLARAQDDLDNLMAAATPERADDRMVQNLQRGAAQTAVRTAQQSMNEIDASMDAMREVLVKLSTAKTLTKAERRMLGTTPVVSSKGLVGRGSAEGERLAETMKSISAGPKNDVIQSSANNNWAEQAWLDSRVRAAGRPAQVNPGDPQYFDHLAHFANTDVRPNTVAMRLLAGDNPGDIADWLLKTPQGREFARSFPEMGGTEPEVDAWLDSLNHNLRATFPHEALQRAIVDGPITAAHGRGYLAGMSNERLEPIMDDAMVRIRDTNLHDMFNRLVDAGFDNLWTKPEDRLARWPLYNQIYRNQLSGDLDRYADHIGSMSEADGNAFIRQLEGAAHKRARTDVTRVIYSAGNRTQVAEKLRFIAPFYQVTTNRLGYYGSQFLENPQNMARMFMGWNSISTTNDQSGKPILTVLLPGWLAKDLGIGDTPGLQFNKSSLNLINSGDPWYSPGFGPIVSVPLAEWLRRHPADTPSWFKTLVSDKALGIYPNGYTGNDAGDLILPAWMHRVRGAEGQQKINTQTQLWAQEMMKYREGLRPSAPTSEEIQKMSDGLWAFRILGAFTLPAQPTLTTGRPDANIGTAGNPRAEALSAMVALHSDYLKKYGSNGDNMFLNDHPEYYDYIVSLSDNPSGILPTDTAVARQQQYGTLATTLQDPKMAGLIFNLANDYGKFDADAYQYEVGQPLGPGSGTVLRDQLQDPMAGYENRVIARGWAEYAKATQERDAFMKMYGYTSIRQSDAAWVKAIFDARVQQIQQDTSWQDSTGHKVEPWFEQYSTQNKALYANRAEDLRRIIDSPGYYDANIGKQPWLAQAATYLHLRDQTAAMLQRIKDSGGSGSIDAASNAWLKTAWETQRATLAAADPQWAQIQATKFSHDDLSDLPALAEVVT